MNAVIDKPTEKERDTAAQLMNELAAWGKRARLSSYCVIANGKCVAIINFKYTDNQLTCIAQRYKDFRRYWWKSTRRGSGYDRQTAALAGFVVGGVTLTDDAYTWHAQLNAVGYEVHQIL